CCLAGFVSPPHCDTREDKGVLASTEKPGGKGGLSTEGQLLLAIASDDNMDPVVRQLAAQPIDWTALLTFAVQERAEAVVSRWLTRVGASLPAAAQTDLSRLAMRSDLRMAVLSRRMDQTITALNQASVPVIL